jgi:putative endonuclease
MANPQPSHYPDIGVLGEDLVTQWLQSHGWIILHRRWRCRWGEIDIIAQHNGDTPTPRLAFVEVKTRSRGNWDAGGRNAITLQKQAKLWRTAEVFLAKYPYKADYACQFDVAVVNVVAKKTSTVTHPEASVNSSPRYELNLQDYIVSAFDQA